MGAILTLLLTLGVLLLLFPYPLFRHSRSFEGLELRSDAPLDAATDAVLRDAWGRILAMELHQAAERHTLFLCRSQGLYRAYCAVARRPSGTQGLIVSSLTRTIILSAPGIEGMRARTGGQPVHSRLEGSLAAAIAHEVAHSQIVNQVGFRRSLSLPTWKSEGWADYSTHRARIRVDHGHALAARVELLWDETAWHGPYPSVDRRHFRWQLLVEFLVEVKRLRFADLLDDELTEAGTWTALTAWLADRRR